MLDINLLRQDIETVKKQLSYKKFDLDIARFNFLELERKNIQVQMEELQAKRNSHSKQIGILKSKQEDASHILTEMTDINNNLQVLEHEFQKNQNELSDFLSHIPNIPDKSVPLGENETQNQEIRRFGVPRDFEFTIKDHVDLGGALDNQIDFELGVKLSGSRFYVLKKQIAKLHRVLAQFMLDTHIDKHGYTEMYVPYIVNKDALFGTGQLPKFEEESFKINKNDTDAYLIATAEIPLTNLIANTILKEEDLPIKMVAHTPCFRSEAGSYGRDTRGMIRVHQFDKVEMVQIVDKDKSNDALEELTHHAESILQALNLPYRVMLLCSGDTGFQSAKTYDLEVWIPSQNTYREISSCSLMTDFQARRMQGRVRKNNKNELVHTLNGSGLAVGRTLVAVIENYQNIDGSITIPEVLRKYMGCDVIR